MTAQAMDRDAWMQPPDYVATIPTLLQRAVATHGAREFMVSGDARISFAEADAASARLAAEFLRRGIGKGTRVGILMPNTPGWIVSFLAATRIGAVAVLISTLYQRRDLGWVLRHADVDTLVMADRYLQHDYVARLEGIAPEIAGQDSGGRLMLGALPYLRRVYVWGAAPQWALPIPEAGAVQAVPAIAEIEALVMPADLALVIYTSGSTAAPKGVMHAHGPMVRRPHIVRGHKMYKPDDRLLSLGPFCWVGGVLAILWALETGFCIVCPPEPKPDSIVATIRRYRPTRIQAQPGQIKQLQNHPDLAADDALGGFLRGQRGRDGTLLPPERFSRGLGMTETVAPHSMELWGEIPAAKPGAFGRGAPDFERSIRDRQGGAPLGVDREGELWVRSHNLMQGFMKKERHEVFDKDGFYPTGDNCRIDADGYIYFSGRSSEMIKTAGANVSPREVELLIEAYPGVEDVGVFALPGEGYDQIVAAVVIPRRGASLDPEALRQWLRSELASFKVPKKLFIEPFERVPRTRSGKLDKVAFAKSVAAA